MKNKIITLLTAVAIIFGGMALAQDAAVNIPQAPAICKTIAPQHKGGKRMHRFGKKHHASHQHFGKKHFGQKRFGKGMEMKFGQKPFGKKHHASQQSFGKKFGQKRSGEGMEMKFAQKPFGKKHHASHQHFGKKHFGQKRFGKGMALKFGNKRPCACQKGNGKHFRGGMAVVRKHGKTFRFGKQHGQRWGLRFNAQRPARPMMRKHNH